MSDSTTKKSRCIAHLLLPGVGKFLMNSSDRKGLEEVMKERGGCVIEEFKVDIIKINPTTREILEWKKIEGFSLWLTKSK